MKFRMHPENIVAGDVYSVHAPDDPTDLYFSSAMHSLLAIVSDSVVGGQRREAIVSSAVMAFLSLESCINRLFFGVFRQKLHPQTPLPGTPLALVNYVERSWGRLSVKDKWLLLPALLTLKPFDAEQPPFQYFDEFARFRNRLVHPKSISAEMKLRATSVSPTEDGVRVDESELIDHIVDVPPPSILFPFTGFSTAFKGLSQSDAEKSVEIAYRMRMSLAEKIPLTIGPHFLYNVGTYPHIKLGSQPDKSPERSQAFFLGEKVGEFLALNVNIHFGLLK